MSDPHIDCALCDLAAAMWNKAAAGVEVDATTYRWDDAEEARIQQVADTYDPETGRSQPLRPRRTA